MTKKEFIWEKYNGCCAYCGEKILQKRCTIDHIISKYNGGKNDIKNLNPSCKFCNGLKGRNSIEIFRQTILYYIKNTHCKYWTMRANVLNHYNKKWNGQFYFEKKQRCKDN